MTDELDLRRKWTLKAHGQQVVVVKGSNERTTHVLMKAFLWALYLPTYPRLVIERKIGDRYKPDVVMLDETDAPIFWGESGQVNLNKIRSLAKRFKQTHLVIAKWTTNLRPHQLVISKALEGIRRSGPVDLIGFAGDSAEKFIDPQGNVALSLEDVVFQRLCPG